MKLNKYVLIMLLGICLVAVPTFAFGLETLPTPPPHAEWFTVTVTDRDTGLGIEDVMITLYLGVEYDPIVYNVAVYYTDGNGVAEFYIMTPCYDIIFGVKAEGYTSDQSKYAFSYYNDGGLIPETVELYPGEPTPFPQTNGDLTVKVTDRYSGAGIPNAKIDLFEDNSVIATEVTDSNGVAIFSNLSGFYQFGVSAEHYTSDRPTDEYAYFGAVGVARDITYPVKLFSKSINMVVLASQLGGLGLALFGGYNYLVRKKKG